MHQIICHVVQFSQSFLQGGWELHVRIIDQMVMGCQESRTQDGVVPIKDNASLTCLGLLTWSKPDLVIGKLGKQVIPDLLIGPRV